jgi:hypothetical protein
MPALITVGFLVIAIWPNAAAGEQAPHASLKACELLTPVELEAAIGGSFSQQSGTEQAYTKNRFLDHDGVFCGCEETVGTRHVTLRITTTPTAADAKKSAETGFKDTEDALRAQGLHVQAKDIGGVRCMTALRPTGPSQVVNADMLGTYCVREKGTYAISIQVGATGSGDALPIEKVAALAERAASRVPAQ